MRLKVIAAFVVAVALIGTSAGVALASRSSHAKTGVEKFWVSNFNPVTVNPEVFVGTGLFTDAGKITGAQGDIVTLSKGGFVVNGSKLTFKFSVNAHTCFATVTEGGTISLHSGKGAYKGISGNLSVSGKIFAVLPRLKNGKCNEANSAAALGTAGVLSGSGTVTLGG
jgi:hypothetical protein